MRTHLCKINYFSNNGESRNFLVNDLENNEYQEFYDEILWMKLENENSSNKNKNDCSKINKNEYHLKSFFIGLIIPE